MAAAVPPPHTITVTITRGEDLVACDLNQRSDPFFVAKWVGPGDNSPEFTSPIVYKTLRPDWVVAAADKNVSLDVVHRPPSLDNLAELQINVWDWDAVGKNDFMGQTTLTFDKDYLLESRGKYYEVWLPLAPRPGKREKVTGRIHARVLYQDAKDVMSASPAGAVCTKHLIRCEVLRGEQLKATDANGKSDPYFVTKWIGGSGERSESVKSVVAPATLNPNWHQIATYSKKTNPPIMTTQPLILSAIATLRVDVYDKDTFGKNEFIGRADIEFSEAECLANDGKPVTKWFDLRSKKKSSSSNYGRICVRFTYESEQAQAARQARLAQGETLLSQTLSRDLDSESGSLEHPLVVICSREPQRYHQLFTAFATNVVLRVHQRNLKNYRNTFRGMDGVDTLLQYLTTDPAWRYEALEPYFSESECDNRGYMVRAKASLIRILLTGAGWTREDATLVCSKFLEDSYIQAVPATKEPEPFEDGAALYKFQNAGVAEIKELLSQADRIGLGLKNQGAAPKYVAVLIPGLASTALECWDSQVAPEWNQERIWLDVLKIGKFAHLKKIQQMLSSNDDTRMFLRHLYLADDGWSDPPGIKVRACEGFGAIDYLSHSSMTQKPTYVWAYVIRALIDVGYEGKNMIAAPYDWRLPPEKLEERDGFFSRLKANITAAVQANGEKAVLICHSMGNRTAQYFLEWAAVQDPAWIDQHVHAQLALGGPFLGAPKTVRGLITGDALGLDMFLVMEESIDVATHLGSLPWLFPLYHQYFPQPLVYLRASKSRGSITIGSAGGSNPSLKRLSSTTSSDSLVRNSDGTLNEHTATHAFQVIRTYQPDSWEKFSRFYITNALLLDNSKHFGSFLDMTTARPVEAPGLPPVLSAPRVKNLWCIYGINIDTETSYYFKDYKGKPHADRSMDKESNSKTPSNPAGLKLVNGIGYETSDTEQPILKGGARSGDGTVPYASLAYPRVWQSECPDLNVEIIEIEGADHREMMSDDTTLFHLLQYMCYGKNVHAEHPRFATVNSGTA